MSRHEWVNSTLGHGANMCRHCLMTDAEAAALGCLDMCDAERAPTDAEIEAMAEKLWDTYRGAKPSSLWIYVDWRDLSMREPHTTSGKQCIAFRAMARVALEGRG